MGQAHPLLKHGRPLPPQSDTNGNGRGNEYPAVRGSPWATLFCIYFIIRVELLICVISRANSYKLLF